MRINFIKSTEKKRITKQLNEQFGIKKIPYLLIKSGKEKIRGFSGHLSKQEINTFSQLTNIETIGIYIIKKEKDNLFRLTVDATHLLKKQLTKNIIEINSKNLLNLLLGKNLDLKLKRGICIIKCKDDFLGCGKSNEEKIFNYIPKNRRIKSKTYN